MRTILPLLLIVAYSHAAEPNELPAAWHGTWTGTLEMPNGKTVAMRIAIEPIKDSKRFRWEITYGEGEKANVRKYELVPDEKIAGRFGLDEKNGIVLDMRLAKDVMHSQFEVGGNLLAARHELRDGKLHYEITSSGKAIETGSEKSAVVKVYPITSVQTAVLSKSK